MSELNTLYAVGSVPTFILRRKDTLDTVEFNHVNGATSTITKETFEAKAQGIPTVSFLKPATGELEVMAEMTSDYIMQQIYGLGLVDAEVGNGVTNFKTTIVKTDALGVTEPIDVALIPVTGSMVIYSEDRSIKYKLVTTVPVAGEYKFDATTRVLTIGGITAIVSVLIDGDVLAEDKKMMTYYGTSRPVMFEGFLNLYKTDENGLVSVETFYYPKLTPNPSMKIEASAEKTTDFGMKFKILAEKRGSKYAMCDIIA